MTPSSVDVRNRSLTHSPTGSIIQALTHSIIRPLAGDKIETHRVMEITVSRKRFGTLADGITKLQHHYHCHHH
ncbi:hypothetical protein E2C01_039443 [Portunus trituberculatus]|uniref:Uncharacterized protein n=1 Tax=Portunus trituberculatus TaxID=210409 RepID=A0A5B7FJP6_PORTR|nr:hypothetical protein [Portunus trituberculatus]